MTSADGDADAAVADRGLAAARPGAPLAAGTGVRMALEPGRGRTAVPVRTTILGAALAIATVVAALTFAAEPGPPGLDAAPLRMVLGRTRRDAAGRLRDGRGARSTRPVAT